MHLPLGQGIRYDTAYENLASNQGVLDFDGAFSLLQNVAQPDTQWSVVYGVSDGEIRVVMGKAYDQVHVFKLDMKGR